MIEKAVESIPDFVDQIIVVDDQSTDATWDTVLKVQKKYKKTIPLQHEKNQGIGGSYITGFRYALENSADLVFTMAGDAQCNTEYMKNMVDALIDNNFDYVKANRFMHLDALAKMPKFRRIGNIVITILTKFSTGYYSIFDSQNGYGVFKRSTLEHLPLDHIGKRYDYENTLLIALAIMNARIKDEPVPAVYGDEKSTIPVFKTTLRALRVVWKGFWKRVYYKYILVNFHPLALFLFSGLFFLFIAIAFSIYLLIARIFWQISPSTGSVMIAVLPFILGFQLTLTAILMDMNNEQH